jgi:hypothetical protein
MNNLILVLTTLLVGLSGCRSNPPEKTAASPKVIRDAIGANLQGWKDGMLPEASWPDAIKKLRPIKIYSDRANTVIALSRQDCIESGYYVYIPISSHLPTSDKEWTFSAIGEDIWTYKRKLGEQDGGGQPATRPELK